MSFFSVGSSDAGRTYPLKDGNPKRVALPNKPSPIEMALGDELHNKLNADGRDYPLFFESKTTGFVRTCSALTEAGLALARDYNTIALKLWRERIDEEAKVLAKRREEANREFVATVTEDDDIF